MHRLDSTTSGHYGRRRKASLTSGSSDMAEPTSSTNDSAYQSKVTTLPNIDFQNLNISFNGFGFVGIYHIGVVSALKTYISHFQIENVCGASAGAMDATFLLGNVPPGKHRAIILPNYLPKKYNYIVCRFPFLFGRLLTFLQRTPHLLCYRLLLMQGN